MIGASHLLHEVYWVEAVQRTNEGSVLKLWGKMLCFQLKKVAVSQGFRLYFSNKIGGIPYDGSEVPYAEASPINEVQVNVLKNHILTTMSTGDDSKKSTSAYKWPSYKKNYGSGKFQYPTKQPQTAQTLELY